MRAEQVVIRKAAPEDAAQLAELMNAAGEGLPAWLWSQMAGPAEDAMTFGAQRVAGTDSGFSYRNAHVAELDGAIAGMLLGYQLDNPYDVSALDDCPEVIRPLLELESQVPGSWYINAIATVPAVRGQGIGSRLMRLAEDLAIRSGSTTLSLIVAKDNDVAVRLYKHLGYAPVALRPIIDFPGCHHSGDWVLMTRDVAQAPSTDRAALGDKP